MRFVYILLLYKLYKHFLLYRHIKHHTKSMRPLLNIIEATMKNMVQIRNVLSTRIYFSSMVEKVSDQILEDVPYSLISKIGNITPQCMHCLSSLSASTLTTSAKIIDLEFIIIITLTFVIIRYIENSKLNELERLHFVTDYNHIRKNTNRFIWIFFIIFTKNIENAI